jgi:hypothetical protein
VLRIHYIERAAQQGFLDLPKYLDDEPPEKGLTPSFVIVVIVPLRPPALAEYYRCELPGRGSS